MTDYEFEDFLDNALDELNHKQDMLREQYCLEACSRWWFDQRTEKLQFFDEADRLVVEADIVEIGSYSERSNSWKWAWANSWVLPGLREKAKPLRALEDITGFEWFGYEHAFEIDDEAMAWEFVAICVEYLGAMACYRAPTTAGKYVFLAITDIRTSY